MDRLAAIELFVKTAELGSMSKAADALNLSTSAASRYLAALEDKLGAKLIDRNTRRLRLTETAQEYLIRCRAILAAMKEADAVVSATSIEPRGVLTITASLSFCTSYIAPILPAFHSRYPYVRIRLLATNRYFDLLDGGVDLAFRTREFEPDSSITVRRLASTKRILAATPSYIQKRGVLVHPRDLGKHDLLLYVFSNRPNELIFTDAQGETYIAPAQGLLDSNDGQIVRAAGLAGLGIIVQPRFVIHDDIVSGRLIPILEGWDLPRLTINMAYHSRHHLPAKIRCFVDFITEHFANMQFEQRWTSSS